MTPSGANDPGQSVAKPMCTSLNPVDHRDHRIRTGIDMVGRETVTCLDCNLRLDGPPPAPRRLGDAR